jgi:hypothetical protein
MVLNLYQIALKLANGEIVTRLPAWARYVIQEKGNPCYDRTFSFLLFFVSFHSFELKEKIPALTCVQMFIGNHHRMNGNILHLQNLIVFVSMKLTVRTTNSLFVF